MSCPHDPRTRLDYRPRTIYPCPACGLDVRAGEGHPEVMSGGYDLEGLFPTSGPWDAWWKFHAAAPADEPPK